MMRRPVMTSEARTMQRLAGYELPIRKIADVMQRPVSTVHRHIGQGPRRTKRGQPEKQIDAARLVYMRDVKGLSFRRLAKLFRCSLGKAHKAYLAALASVQP